ncbi:MAG: hypothetical protein OFPI_06240 [Osedax symbiont Rs2]|nr:MAG: hypothetical protein OFPI_06240 [Osedax symbiont Rs2]
MPSGSQPMQIRRENKKNSQSISSLEEIYQRGADTTRTIMPFKRLSVALIIQVSYRAKQVEE